MSWFLPFVGLEKKICRYLLQRYLGQFLEEKLNLEQLNIDLYNGKGTVKDVALNCESLNELCESQGWGIEVTGGHVGAVTITVPWNAPMTNDSYIEVSDLSITLRPLPRETDGSSMLESMWSSMSSSMQLAQECIEKGQEYSQLNAQNATIEGLEKFAQTIDSVLNRIKAKLENTEIRIEYLSPNTNTGIAIIIKINQLEYQNEAGNDPLDNIPPDLENENTNSGENKTHLISTYANHHIKLEGITFYTEEFRISSDNPNIAKNEATITNSFLASQQFYSVISQLNTTTDSSNATTTTENNDHTINPENNKDNDDEILVTPIKYSTRHIQIGQLEGQQVIRIKMKQSETINGPKVSLDLQLGTLYIFISPRQLHLLIAFYDIFIKDQQKMEKISFEKNMKSKDQQQKNLNSNMSGIIGGNLGGWSCDPVDESSPSLTGSSVKDFFMKNRTATSNNMHRDNNSRAFEYCESISSSMTTSSSTTCSSKFQRKTANTGELNSEISHFNIRIASVTAILLHADILIENCIPTTGTPLSEESISQLINLSNLYFKNVNNTLENNTETSSYICNKNHLKLYLTPIIVEGEQQRNNSFIILKLTTSITQANFDEVLDNISVPLIDFDRKEICSNGFHKRPEITIAVKTTTPANSNGNRIKKSSPLSKTDININLEACTVELDITLYDRLIATFSESPFTLWENKKNVSSDDHQHNVQQSTAIKNKDPIIEFKVDSTKLDIQLRFPIIDSRPLHDSNRIPWWKKNIRADYLLISFFQFRLRNSSTFIEVFSNEIDIYYCETANSDPIHICKSTLVDNSGIASKESYIEYPKFSIEFPSEKSLQTILKCSIDDSDSGETSGESCSLYTRRNRESLPFSSKRVCRQSDTPHLKDDLDDSETILLPGESAEMKNFCDKAMKISKLQFKVFLPVASVQIKSKLLYEIIYNRFNSDLLMWEPITKSLNKRSEKLKPQTQRPSRPKQSIDQMLWTSGMMDSLYIPAMPSSSPNNNNNQQNDEKSNCSSDGPDTECESDSIYYSTYDRKRTKRGPITPPISLNDCSFELIVNQAVASLYAPVRDSENHVIPEQLGEYVFEVDMFNLFSVSGFNGNENLSYLCIQSKSAKLYHCGLIPNMDRDPMLRLINSILPDYILPTIYPTPNNFTLNVSKSIEKREMISFAIEIKKVPEQRIKRLRITAGIQNTTLKHNPAASQHTWLNQIIDLFDVLDYPIEGYEPYSIVTEMQLHLWNCAVDYRPLNFGYRAVVEVGDFTLSSNIISTVAGCTLRFIAEDCALSLAPYDYKTTCNPSYVQSKINLYSSKNLVPVLDIGLLDISLRLNDKVTDIFPKLDLRASIQDMHIRTCSDSGQALALLIGYLASDGDLSTKIDEDGTTISLSSEGSTDLLSVEEPKNQINEISAKQQERINKLMAEAIHETVLSENYKSGGSDSEEHKFDKGVELFFFPDENQLKQIEQKEKDLKIRNDNKKRDNSPESFRIPNSESSSKLTRSSSSEEWKFKTRRESESSNELKEILNFENNVMSLSYMVEDEAVEALPQIREELGEVPPCKVSPGEKCNISRKSSLNVDDDFYFIADEEKAFISKCGIKDLKVSSEPLRIVDNHFTSPIGKPDLLKAPDGFPMAVTRYTLCEITVTWHMYGGNDFPEKEVAQKEANKNKENILPRRKGEMSEAYKLGVSYSKGRQNVQFGKKPISKISWKNRGGAGRNHDILVEMQLTKMRFSHEIYPTDTNQASRQVLVISQLEIRDRLQTSDINKFLYHPTAKHLPSKSSQHMVVIKALHIRPHPLSSGTQECSLRISLLPLRLNIDQDTLLFLVQFFNDLSRSSSDNDYEDNSNNVKKSSNLQEPVMMVDDIPEAVHDLQSRKMVSTNLELLMEDDQLSSKHSKETPVTNTPTQTGGSDNDVPIYFKEVIFSPEVLIRLDYHGRRIEMSRGPLAGLLMGLGQLQCSEIRLKKIVHKHGLLGVDKLLSFLLKEWLQDIKKNQLPTILSGVGPMHTFIQLFQGIRDLFWLPIEQFQKDGRIIRGLQLGAQSFGARTIFAAIEITSKLIQLLQITAETAFDMLSPGPSVRRGRCNRKGKRKRPHRPQDIREGVANAYQIVKDGINDTACALIENTAAEHDQKGYTGAVGAVFRQIPPLVVCPVVLATQATTNVLGGVKNQLVPDARFEAREKWKDETD